MLDRSTGLSHEKELPMTTKLDEAKGIDEAKGKVNNALSRLEKMIEQRLREETARADELAAKLAALETSMKNSSASRPMSNHGSSARWRTSAIC